MPTNKALKAVWLADKRDCGEIKDNNNAIVVCLLSIGSLKYQIVSNCCVCYNNQVNVP